MNTDIFLLSSLLVRLIQSKMCCCCYWHYCCCYLCYWRRFWYSCWCIVSSKCLPAIIFVHKFVSPKIDAYTASWNGFVKCVKFWLCKILTKHSIIALFSKSFFFHLVLQLFVGFLSWAISMVRTFTDLRINVIQNIAQFMRNTFP